MKLGDERSNNAGTRSDKPTEVAAGNVVPLLWVTARSEEGPASLAQTRRVAAHLLHDKRVHHVEHVPRHPHGPVLVEEGSAFKAERQRRSSVRQKIKPSRQEQEKPASHPPRFTLATTHTRRALLYVLTVSLIRVS